MGDLDRAMDHFEAAMAFCNRASYRPELAWTCCDYADAPRQRDAEGDRAKAIALPGRVLGHFQRTGHAAFDGAGLVPAGDTEGLTSLCHPWRLLSAVPTSGRRPDSSQIGRPDSRFSLWNRVVNFDALK